MDPANLTPDETPVDLLNPLSRDVTYELLDDNNKPQSFTLQSMTVSTHPKYRADILLKRLMDEVINDRKIGFPGPNDREKILQEILI